MKISGTRAFSTYKACLRLKVYDYIDKLVPLLKEPALNSFKKPSVLNKNLRIKKTKIKKKRLQDEVLDEDSYKWDRILRGNPYVKLLISPIRRDILTDARLPSGFFLSFLACKDSETNKIWILPNGLRHKVVKKVGQSRWMNCNKKHIKYVGMKHWKRILIDFAPVDAIWRSDMEEFVLKELRKKVIIELKRIENKFLNMQLIKGRFVENIENEKLKKKIGCIIHKFEDDRIWYLESINDQVFKVPVINVSILFDCDDNENEWVKKLVFEKSTGIPLEINTVNAIFWIWKLRGYF
ncbi:hypothetical protein T552_02073 [Pneumocystis carinii B80]|uniref:Required for respiratory growth protein 8, mitochondrial n=1 Tax=Pneumocystis carinii (strain B80) TaxID=1408658 RepID=A0A0W4ZGY3_PNEC8|nr:hypothetical protein T552_02073 [Pneumocystis carinii B80]KTW27631.1 hypothetical protein T552_02073 [Pneumocystis carinii B80]